MNTFIRYIIFFILLFIIIFFQSTTAQTEDDKIRGERYNDIIEKIKKLASMLEVLQPRCGGVINEENINEYYREIEKQKEKENKAKEEFEKFCDTYPEYYDIIFLCFTEKFGVTDDYPELLNERENAYNIGFIMIDYPFILLVRKKYEKYINFLKDYFEGKVKTRFDIDFNGLGFILYRFTYHFLLTDEDYAVDLVRRKFYQLLPDVNYHTRFVLYKMYNGVSSALSHCLYNDWLENQGENLFNLLLEFDYMYTKKKLELEGINLRDISSNLSTDEKLLKMFHSRYCRQRTDIDSLDNHKHTEIEYYNKMFRDEKFYQTEDIKMDIQDNNKEIQHTSVDNLRMILIIGGSIIFIVLTLVVYRRFTQH